VIATVSTHGGQVKLANGDVWTARSEAGELEPGTPIHVSRIDGATAVVRSDAPTASPTEDPRA
jgi:membrane protein implicated in regulation of membrane protease activity